MPQNIKRHRLFGMGVILTMLVSMTVFSALTQIASAADTISTSQYLDTNGDGTVDTIRWTMDENVTACTYEAEDWTINTAGTINVSAINGISCTGLDAILNISVTATGSITGGATDPQISYDNDDTDNSVTLTSGAMTNKGTVTATDGAAPVVQGGGYLDNDGNGTIDRVQMGFTENVTYTYQDTDWAATANGLTSFDVSNCTSCSNVSFLVLTAGAQANLTGVSGGTEPNLAYTAGNNIQDQAAVPNNAANFTLTGLTDGAAPVIINRLTDDNDGNGKIERIDFQVTEGLNDNFTGFTTADITVNGYTVNAVNTGSAASDAWFRVGINENAGTCNMSDQSGCTTVSTPLTQITTNTSLGDGNGNLIPTDGASIAPTDSANPVALGGYYADNNGDGQVDTVGIYFSENVTYTYQDSDWTPTVNNLTSFDVTSCASCTNIQPILLNATAALNLTGVSGGTEPDLAYTAGNNIQDQAGSPNNAANFTLTGLTDAAAPQIDYADSTTAAGTYGPASTINIRLFFTEQLNSPNLAILLDTGATVNSGALVSQGSYSGTYTVGATGSGENSTDLSISSVTGTITDGPNPTLNPAVPAGSNIDDNEDIVVDTTAPSVSTVTPNDTTISDADFGSDKFYLDIDFNETMAGASTPVVAFTPDLVAGGTLTLSGTSNWTDGDTYRIYYNVADVNTTVTLTNINISAATDAAGNLLTAYAGGGESVIVDTSNPTVTGVTPNDTLLTDADFGANKFYVDIDYSENMAGGSTPSVGFTPNIVATGTLTLSGLSGWQDADTYRAYYNVGDVNEVQTLTGIGVISATDVAGNTQTGYAGGGAGVSVDTLNPSVLSITPDTSLLTDADVGASAITVVVIFDETMDTTVGNEPTVAFAAPAPAGLSFNSDGWSTTNVANDTYTASFDLADSNESVSNIDIDVTLGMDAAGNTQNAGSNADALDIDTQNPTVTGITPNDLLITDGDVGPGTFWVDIDYSETMAGAGNPTVTFTPDIVTSGTLTLNTGVSGWTDGDTYQAVYDVADVDENVTLTNINVSGAADAVGNVQVGFNDGTGSGVQVATIGPVVTIVQPAHGGATRMANPLIVTTDVNCNCTYDIDLSGPVALNQTGLLTHTDNLTGLAAGAHTVDISCTDIVTANVGTASSTWTKQAQGNMVLYGVDGAGSALGVLWTLDPETGSKLTNIGAVGNYYVTGLAVNPVTGRMYASTGAKDPGNGSDQALLEIDMTTGAATYLGKNWDGVANNHHLADIAFDSTGTLYGWSEQDDNLYSVDLASCNANTCSATLIGASGLSTYGSGLSFDSGNTLFFVGEDEDNNMYTISTATGAPLLTIPLLNGNGFNYTLNASAFDSTDMFFSARGNWPGVAPAALVVIDTPTGIVASLGDIADMILMNAIEIYEDTLAPAITITAPTKSSTAAITNTTVQVIDPGGILAANVTATGGTLNCTQTSGTQIDCTSTITVSGTLTVTATDNWGNAGVLAEAGYTITAGGGGGGGAAGGSGTPYVAPATTTTEEETLTEEGTGEGEEGATE